MRMKFITLPLIPARRMAGGTSHQGRGRNLVTPIKGEEIPINIPSPLVGVG